MEQITWIFTLVVAGAHKYLPNLTLYACVHITFVKQSFIVMVNCILISKHIHYYCTNGTMDKLFSGYHFEAPGAYQPAKEHETYNEINRQVVSM